MPKQRLQIYALARRTQKRPETSSPFGAFLSHRGAYLANT
ncbi:hypothetical protein HMPREF3214_00072 [Alloscardovia omnicolens]|nr:hypothetical protein HMPREF3214_00072 [Alloscardovia omnicolens]